MCGALVGTLSNKKEFPTTTSSGEVADHREHIRSIVIRNGNCFCLELSLLQQVFFQEPTLRKLTRHSPCKNLWISRHRALCHRSVASPPARAISVLRGPRPAGGTSAICSVATRPVRRGRTGMAPTDWCLRARRARAPCVAQAVLSARARASVGMLPSTSPRLC